MENAMVRMRHTTELSRLFLIFSLVKIEFRKKSLSASFLSALTVSHFFFLDLPQSLLSSLYLWSSSSFWLQLLHSLLAVPMLTCFYSSLLINGKTKFASLFILCFTIFLNQLSVCINNKDIYNFEVPVPLCYAFLLLFPPLFSQRAFSFLIDGTYLESPKIQREWVMRSMTTPLCFLLLALYSLLTISIVYCIERKRASA